MSPEQAHTELSAELATAEDALRQADAHLDALSTGTHAHRAYDIPNGADTRFTDNYTLTVFLEDALRATRAARALDDQQTPLAEVQLDNPSLAYHRLGIDLATAHTALRRSSDLALELPKRHAPSGDPIDKFGHFIHYLTDAGRSTHAALAINDRIQTFAQTA